MTRQGLREGEADAYAVLAAGISGDAEGMLAVMDGGERVYLVTALCSLLAEQLGRQGIDVKEWVTQRQAQIRDAFGYTGG